MSIGSATEVHQTGSSRFPEETPKDEITEKKMRTVVFNVLSKRLADELASKMGFDRDKTQSYFALRKVLEETDLEIDISPQKDLERLRGFVNTLQAENAALVEKLTAVEANQGLPQKELKSLREKVESLKTDKVDLTEQLRISTAKLASSQKDPEGLRRIGVLEAENKKLSEELRSLKKFMTATQAEKQTAEKKVKDLGEELQGLQRKHRALIQSVEDSKKASAPEKEKINQLQTQLNALKKDNEILLHQLDLANSKAASASEAESRTSDKAREEMISMGRELEELKELLRIQSSLAGKAEKERGDLTKATAELERVSAVLKTREQECEEITKKLNRAQSYVRQLCLVRFAYRPRPDIPLKTTEL